MPFANNSELPKGVKDNLPEAAQSIWRGAFNGALSGTCKGDDTCASKIAWSAVERKYKKNAEGKWVAKADLIDQFSFIITKASYDEKTHLTRWAATASDTDKDLYDQRMSLDLFRDFIRRATANEQAPMEFQSEFWQGGMPYVSVSHYPDMNGEAVPGDVTALFIDGNRFKAKGFFYDNPLGIACGRAIKQSLNQPDNPDNPKIRISIAFIDWKHAHGNMIFERKSLGEVCPACMEGQGEKVFLAGQLIHLALTRVPVNQRTDVEVDLSMAIKTQLDDAESIVGKDLADELEEKKRSLVSQSEAIVVRSDTEEEVEQAPAPEAEEQEAISARKDVTPADKKRAEKEYGNVTYADEKNKKYPLDTEKHIRAAWSYIHMPRNQSKYSADEVKSIEAKIVSAWKKVIGKDGPPEVKKGMISMESIMDEATMGGMSPEMYMPYDGAISFKDAQDYMTAQDALNNFYNDWGMFQNLAMNILTLGDIPDKVGAMKSLVEEFKGRLDQSTADAVQEMSQYIRTLKQPEPQTHPLDDAIMVLKSQFTEVSSKPELDREQKLALMQESFNGLGEAVKGAIPESQAQPESVQQESVPSGIDVNVLKTAFSEALAPVLQTLQLQSESIRLLQQLGSANAGVNQTRQAVPTRRSLNPELVNKSVPATTTPSTTPKLREIIMRSVQ